MDSQVYFDVEKISVMEVREESLSDYIFYPPRPEEQLYIFGFIPAGKRPALPERWSSGNDGWYYKTDQELRGCSWYRIDDKEKKMYHKAQVTVHLGYKETVSRVFDSTAEAKEWANHIIEISGKTLELLIK
jgi:hypothetical protein